jgi:hypothetical protein
VETATCRVCRSVNHAGLSRCMNCGSPMELPAVPIGVALDDLPPAPDPSAQTYGWNAQVATSAGRGGASSSIAIVLGLIAVVTFLVSVFMIVGSEAPFEPSGTLAALLTALWAVTVIFWFWMLIDSISNSRVGWALAIFFLGVIAALAYALLGRSRRASY